MFYYLFYYLREDFLNRNFPYAFRERVREKHQWYDSCSRHYYHYTSLTNAMLILESKNITTTVARWRDFGHGVFMTIMEPNKSDHELLENNYRGNSRYLERIECAFAIRNCDIAASKVNDRYGRDVWRCDSDIDLETVEFYLINRTSRSIYN
jgi:hypothetical protein